MCGWGPYAREASVWEACCRYSGVINMFLNCPKSVHAMACLAFPMEATMKLRLIEQACGCAKVQGGATDCWAIQEHVYNITVPATCLPHTGFAGVWTPATHAELICHRTIHKGHRCRHHWFHEENPRRPSNDSAVLTPDPGHSPTASLRSTAAVAAALRQPALLAAWLQPS